MSYCLCKPYFFRGNTMMLPKWLEWRKICYPVLSLSVLWTRLLVGNQEPRIWKEELMRSHLVLCQYQMQVVPEEFIKIIGSFYDYCSEKDIAVPFIVIWEELNPLRMYKRGHGVFTIFVVNVGKYILMKLVDRWLWNWKNIEETWN